MVAVAEARPAITPRVGWTLVIDIALLSEADTGEAVAAARVQRGAAVLDALLRRILSGDETSRLRLVALFAYALAIHALHAVGGLALFADGARTAQPSSWIALTVDVDRIRFLARSAATNGRRKALAG